jgi:hypothetical protein
MIKTVPLSEHEQFSLEGATSLEATQLASSAETINWVLVNI